MEEYCFMEHKIIHLKDYFPRLGENDRDATVEAYLQTNMTEMGRQDCKRPVLIVCPGGGYEMCSQRESEPIAVSFLPDGFNVFTITYSVAPHRFPAQLQEMAALLELIHLHSDDWNCDTQKIVLIGFSAGGHLAAHYANAYDCPEVRALFPQSKPVNATVLAYPVISAEPGIGHMGSFDNLLGTQQRTEIEIERFSCDKLVSNHTPPAYLYHMAEDGTVAPENSLLYAKALMKRGVPCEMHLYPHGYHGTSTCDTQTVNDPRKDVVYSASWLFEAKAWLKYMGIVYDGE